MANLLKLKLVHKLLEVAVCRYFPTAKVDVITKQEGVNTVTVSLRFENFNEISLKKLYSVFHKANGDVNAQ